MYREAPATARRLSRAAALGGYIPPALIGNIIGGTAPSPCSRMAKCLREIEQ